MANLTPTEEADQKVTPSDLGVPTVVESLTEQGLIDPTLEETVYASTYYPSKLKSSFLSSLSVGSNPQEEILEWSLYFRDNNTEIEEVSPDPNLISGDMTIMQQSELIDETIEYSEFLPYSDSVSLLTIYTGRPRVLYEAAEEERINERYSYSTPIVANAMENMLQELLIDAFNPPNVRKNAFIRCHKYDEFSEKNFSTMKTTTIGATEPSVSISSAMVTSKAGGY
jgi:hypothetical protein